MRVNINWRMTNINDILYYEDAYFYIFTSGSSLLYIGIAYLQDVDSEIKQTIRAFNLNSKNYPSGLDLLKKQISVG
ncbi:MAG: hypothetical protein ACOYU0_03170 [Nitrospirota bacterium]